MTPEPWLAPGPSAFLDDVCGDLDGGVVACLELPQTCDEGSLQDAVTSRFGFMTCEFVGAIPGVRPLRTVSDALRLAPGETPSSLRALMEGGFLRDHLMWISGLAELPETDQAAWVQFAERVVAYADDTGELVSVVLCSHGDGVPLALPDSARLRVRRWWNVVGRLDLAVLVTGLTEKVDPVAREEIVELAVDDWVLAIRLASASRSPSDWVRHCQQRAEELGIDDFDLAGIPSRCTPKNARSAWLRGVVSAVDGSTAFHSGVLAAAGRARDLERRRWASQIRSMLPRIDLLRVALLDVAVAREVIAPWRAGGTEPEVEFKDVARSLDGVPGLAAEAALAKWLHHTRNHLAHLRCLAPEKILEGRRLADRAGLEWP